MNNYTVKVLPDAKLANGKGLSLERVLGRIEGAGGKVIAERMGINASVLYHGDVQKLYEAIDLGYDQVSIKVPEKLNPLDSVL